MKTRIFSAAMVMAMTFAISCNDDTVSPQGPAGPALQENAVIVHAVMDEDMTKVTLGDDSGASTQVHWDAEDQIGIRIDETTYTFDRTDDAVGSKTADFEYKAGGVALPTLTAGEYTFTYPATGKAALASQTGTKEGLKAYHYMEATFTAEEEQDWNNLPGLSFETKVAIVKLTLKNEAFKGKEVTGVTLRSAEDAYAATSVFTGSAADGSIVAYFAVEPGSLTGCVIGATCEDDYYEASLSNNTLSAGRLYRVNKTMAKAHIDLSPVVAGVNRTANSYIVSKAGDYKFKATHKGNSTSSTVGTIKSAVVLWESFGTSTAPSEGDLVKNVDYSDGYITFTATAAEGNAVIAAKDASDKILWSWHIWLTDKPAEHEYANSAGTMMDRNLGATSATPGDVGALGLLYQWGRKDPFLGSSSTSSSTEAQSTLTWPSPVQVSTLPVDATYHIANPTTFITSNNSRQNYDWFFTSSSEYHNDRWPDSGSPKSIYDPCPAGWRVPDGGENGIWAKAHGSSAYYNSTYDSAKRGFNFSGDFGESSPIWYPLQGQRGYDDGILKYVGLYGRYWSCSSPTGAPEAYLLYTYYSGGTVNPMATTDRANGLPVRCCKE